MWVVVGFGVWLEGGCGGGERMDVVEVVTSAE